jgi:ketosteroid isomerase-like protein
MKPSPAIREIQLRWVQATKATDVASVLALWSSEPGVMVIGTDPSEWLTTREAIEQLERAYVEGAGGPIPDDLEIVAYEEGTVGWANLRYTLKFPNGGSCLIRWTVIFHQEGGQWKGVSGHASIGVPDDKVMTFFSPA